MRANGAAWYGVLCREVTGDGIGALDLPKQMLLESQTAALHFAVASAARRWNNCCALFADSTLKAVGCLLPRCLQGVTRCALQLPPYVCHKAVAICVLEKICRRFSSVDVRILSCSLLRLLGHRCPRMGQTESGLVVC